MTDKEKYDFFKKAYPDKSDAEIKAAVKEFKVLQGGLAGGQIAKAILEFGKSFFTKKTAAKVAEETAKKGKKKIITKGRVIGTGVAASGVGIYNTIASGKTAIDPNASAAELQAQDSFAQAIANADAQGVDVTQFLQGNTAQQLGIGVNNIADFMAARGFTNPLTGLNGIGIFTGKETETSVPRKKFGGTISVSKPEVVSLSQWNKSFPVDAAGIASAKQKFVSAGVLNPDADLVQIKSAWDKYGQLSLDYSRAGNKVSPWQLLDIQKGLTGGGGSKTEITIDESPIAEADIKQVAKNQLAKSLGLATIDDEAWKSILKIVRKNEAKKPTKTVITKTGNKVVRKTTPGYGQSDILADVEAYAKTDPRYQDFQTADVFGNALVRALGLKS